MHANPFFIEFARFKFYGSFICSDPFYLFFLVWEPAPARNNDNRFNPTCWASHQLYFLFSFPFHISPSAYAFQTKNMVAVLLDTKFLFCKTLVGTPNGVHTNCTRLIFTYHGMERNFHVLEEENLASFEVIISLALVIGMQERKVTELANISMHVQTLITIFTLSKNKIITHLGAIWVQFFIRFMQSFVCRLYTLFTVAVPTLISIIACAFLW